jgi:hypothetical protein
MAKITKLVFDIKGKEYVFSYDDARELYQEMSKIFNAKPIKEQFEYDPPPVGSITSSWPLKDDYISFGTMMPAGEAITSSVKANLHNIKGNDGVFGAIMDDSITVSNYDWAAKPAAQSTKSNDPWVGTTYAFHIDEPYADTTTFNINAK